MDARLMSTVIADQSGRALRALENFTFQHPQLARRALGFLRTVKPVLRVGDVAVVTRYGEVREVLSRDDDFSIGLYAPKMEAAAGHFILGMQNIPRYEHDVSVLRLAVPRSDLPRIREVLDGILAEIFAAAGPSGQLDVVQDLTDKVPARLSARYFGTPGPDETTLIQWGRRIFREFFYNIRNDPVIARPAAVAAAGLVQHVGENIAGRDGRPSGVGDVLDRMLQLKVDGHLGIDDAWVQTYLFGMVVGMLPLTSKATTLALDVLLRRPGMLAGAQEAARTGNDDLLWRYISEAMRIAPQSPGQFRLAEGDWTIGGESGRRYSIPSGTRVLAATQAAMFDRRVFPRPGQVRTNRPASQYLHFGYGLHSCYGRYISYQAQIPRMIKALLTRRNLRRAEGGAGRLKWKDAFPDSLHVEFEPS
jgi:cytochrome P450